MQIDYLTAPLLQALIDCIDVFETEGIVKNRTQRIVIYYRFVGHVEIPSGLKRPHYKVDTRQGISVEHRVSNGIKGTKKEQDYRLLLHENCIRIKKSSVHK